MKANALVWSFNIGRQQYSITFVLPIFSTYKLKTLS